MGFINQIDGLLEEAKVIEEIMQQIQQDEHVGLSLDEIESVRQQYIHWYSNGLVLLSDDLSSKFEEEYKSKFYDSKIEGFISAPIRTNVFNPTDGKPRSPLISYWQHPYSSTFYRRFLNQQSILRQARAKYINDNPIPTLPADLSVTDVLSSLDISYIHDQWRRLLERRASDPAAAITSARSLTESVCKYILDKSSIEYTNDGDLGKLYKAALKAIGLDASTATDQTIKQMLGGCSSAIAALSALRNQYGDAHGKGVGDTEPYAIYAHLAVNLAGTMCSFMIERWKMLNSDL